MDLLSKLLVILVTLAATAGVTTLSSLRDGLSALRFRELYPATVTGDLDKSRNKRWHRVGLWQRLAYSVLIAAAVGGYFHSWPIFFVSVWLSAWTTAAQFDVDFNIRLRLPFFYTGTTSQTDIAHSKVAGLVFVVKCAAVLLGIFAWLVFIK